MEILQTKRLILRTTRTDDLKDLYEKIFSNFDVVQYTFGKEKFDYESTKEFILKKCNFNSSLGLSVIVRKEDEEVIGLGGPMKSTYLEKEDYEFGFILSKEAWGKGYATEIGEAQIDFIKEEFNATRVLALVDPKNEASINTIKKLGLSYLKDINTSDSRGLRQVYIKEFK